MLEVMQEHKVTVANASYKLEEPFFVLATENPIEQDGTYPLPEAQMDRFMFKLIMNFPANSELVDIVKMTQITMEETAKAVVGGEDILEMRDLASTVPVIDEVLDYAIRLVANTHPELENASSTATKYIKYGASPRAAQALITCAKVRALMNGNYNVSYADIDALAHAVLRHRIKINYNAVNDKLSVDDVIDLLLKETAGRLNKSKPTGQDVPVMQETAVSVDDNEKIVDKKEAKMALKAAKASKNRK